MIISKEELLSNFLHRRTQKLYVSTDDTFYDLILVYTSIEEESNILCRIEEVATQIQFLLLEPIALESTSFRANVFWFDEADGCFITRTLNIIIKKVDTPEGENIYYNILPPRIEGVGNYAKNIKRYECKLLSFDSYNPEQRLK